MWFLSEPVLFAALCTHQLLENFNMRIPYRTGRMRIEYNPELIRLMNDFELEEYLKVEIYRILLQHPYKRLPTSGNRAAIALASDYAIVESTSVNVPLERPSYRNLESNLCYESYYEKLKYMIDECDSSGFSDENKKMESEGRARLDDGLSFQSVNYTEKGHLFEESEENVEKIQDIITKAIQSNQWGSIPGKLQQELEATLIVKMDYRDILSSFRASLMSSERKSSRLRPNRRYGYQYMGNRYRKKTKLLVAVDTSGSISNLDLTNFFSIINRFFSYGVKSVDVCEFDSTVQSINTLKKSHSKINITGRGGTEFQPVIDLYESSENKYEGLIVFTDGYASPPVFSHREKRVLWIFTDKYSYEQSARWIKKFHLAKTLYIPSQGGTN